MPHLRGDCKFLAPRYFQCVNVIGTPAETLRRREFSWNEGMRCHASDSGKIYVSESEQVGLGDGSRGHSGQ